MIGRIERSYLSCELLRRSGEAVTDYECLRNCQYSGSQQPLHSPTIRRSDAYRDPHGRAFDASSAILAFAHRFAWVPSSFMNIPARSFDYAWVPSSSTNIPARQSIDSYKALLTVAREYKTQGLAYSDARRLLKEEAAGLVIKKRDYYNLVRLCPQDIKDDDDTITALLRALEDRAFKYRLRTEDTIEDGVVIARKLVQIFFYCEQAVPFTQRFTSNAVLIVDGTFRTNKLKFPLLVAVGKTNTNRTMPVAFSYAPSESAESFVFFFDSGSSYR
ncbi:MULE transposase domain protein [Metarhizium robertsii]|uniref:MULE transposase domain protein n=1 Tax=Metarhizium robertsii TaxID=568076 RepID=A0A014N4W2_9HYPO|nr:MULE transposase domain protein [Metarhizium robertsii]